ncbi:MAG: hypothetical protein D6686_02985 [Alphaproteobacteria bacterium]|nr:MAG: hypothetical protein D6686_02985 [Alphaproteobacteria bacterium]
MVSRPVRIGAALAGIGVIGAGAAVHADPDGWTLTGAVSEELRALTNPDLRPGGGGDATLRATTRLSATLTRESATTAIGITGAVSPVIAEAGDMPDNALGILAPSLGLRLLVEGPRSRLTARLRGSLTSTAFTDLLFGTDEEGVIDPTDPTVVTGDAIRATLGGTLTLDWEATPRDSFSLGLDASRVDFFDGTVALVPITTLGLTGGWTRALTPTLDGTLTAGVTWFEADSPQNPRSIAASLTGGFVWTVNDRLQLSGGLGASLTRTETALPADSDLAAGLTGNLALTYAGADDSLRLSFSHGVQPSTLGALQNTTSFTARYDHAVNSVSALGFEARAQRQSAVSGGGGDILALRLGPYYSHQLDADTSLRLGYVFELSERDGAGTARSHAVFLTLTRGFNLLQ